MKYIAFACALLIASAALAEKEANRFCEPCLDVDEFLWLESVYQTISGSTVGEPNGEHSYSFCTTEGATVTFTFCHDGGQADYDTALSIQGPDECGTDLACNDDWCYLQSELVWTVPNGQQREYILVVDGYSGSEGDYVLAYHSTGSFCIVPTETSSWSTVKAMY